jgi:uncharacterized protein with PQ loop repeat
MVLELVGLTAAFLILAASWPQLREVLSAGTQGISLGSWSLFLSAGVVWGTYGWKIGSPSTVIGNVAGALAFSVLVTAIVATRTSLTLAIPSVIGSIAALLTISVILPTPVVGALGVAIGFTLAMPQIVVSWRTRGDAVNGVAHCLGNGRHRSVVVVALRVAPAGYRHHRGEHRGAVGEHDRAPTRTRTAYCSQRLNPDHRQGLRCASNRYGTCAWSCWQMPGRTWVDPMNVLLTFLVEAVDNPLSRQWGSRLRPADHTGVVLLA